MFQPISFPEDVEARVRLLEETPPERAVGATVQLLRQGVPEAELAAAAALAVCRSSELPFVHHGGPLHPVAALPAVRGTLERLETGRRWLPLIQEVALVSRHIHDTGSAPYVMPAMVPRGAGSVAETVGAFHGALRRNVPAAAEQHFLWLLENAPRETALEALLSVAVRNYRYDEHKLILAVNTIRGLEWIGWEHAPALLRVAVRYNFLPSVWAERGSSEQMERRQQHVDGLVEELAASTTVQRLAPKAEEPLLLGVREAAREATEEEVPTAIADALRRGVSMDRAAEAVSVAACDLFLETDTRNPMGIHFMTGANAIRWVCRHFPALGPRALLSWALGPETRGVKQSARAPLSARRGNYIQLAHAITANDAPAAAAMALSLAAAEHAALMLPILAFSAAADDATEMHALKHHQAMAEEWTATRREWAAVHLAAQAKEAALHAHLGVSTFEQAVIVLG